MCSERGVCFLVGLTKYINYLLYPLACWFLVWLYETQTMVISRAPDNFLKSKLNAETISPQLPITWSSDQKSNSIACSPLFCKNGRTSAPSTVLFGLFLFYTCAKCKRTKKQTNLSSKNATFPGCSLEILLCEDLLVFFVDVEVNRIIVLSFRQKLTKTLLWGLGNCDLFCFLIFYTELINHYFKKISTDYSFSKCLVLSDQ